MVATNKNTKLTINIKTHSNKQPLFKFMKINGCAGFVFQMSDLEV